MPNTINNGGPAFPVHGGGGIEDDPRNHTLGGGLTVRDYFAGQALANIADAYNGQAFDPIGCASIAYEYADAMLKARESL